MRIRGLRGTVWMTFYRALFATHFTSHERDGHGHAQRARIDCSVSVCHCEWNRYKTGNTNPDTDATRRIHTTTHPQPTTTWDFELKPTSQRVLLKWVLGSFQPT